MNKKLMLLTERLASLGLYEQAGMVVEALNRLSKKEKSEEQSIKDKYERPHAEQEKTHHSYKGGKGERFDNCVKEKLELDEHGGKKLHKTDEKGNPRTKEESAVALCGWIDAHK